jgi:hypothetical protein
VSSGSGELGSISLPAAETPLPAYQLCDLELVSSCCDSQVSSSKNADYDDSIDKRAMRSLKAKNIMNHY